MLGPIRAVVLWTTSTERSWTRAGSVCDFLLRKFGPVDSLVTMPGMDALTMKNMHICMCTAKDDDRQWFYAYQLPDARCGTSALVFWTVPWTLSSDALDADQINARIDGAMKARAFNSLTASVHADASCEETLSSFARGVVLAMIAGAISVLLLLALLYGKTV